MRDNRTVLSAGFVGRCPEGGGQRKEETLIGRGAAALTMDLDYTGEEQVQLKVYSQSYLPGIAQSYLLIQTAEGNDVQNYVLPAG